MLATLVRKSLLGNRRITLWTLATLTTCAALVVMFTTIAIDIQAKMRGTLREMGANAVIYPVVSRQPETPSAGRGYARWNAVEQACQRSGADLLLLTLRVGTIQGTPVAVIAADKAGLARMTPYWSLTGQRATAPDQCLVGKKLAHLLQVQQGSHLHVAWPRSPQVAHLTVVGIFESGDDDEDRLFVTSHLSGAGETAAMPHLPPGHPDLAGLLHHGQVNCLACHTSGIPTGTGQVPTPHVSHLIGSAATEPAYTYALLSMPSGEAGITALSQHVNEAAAGVEVKPMRQVVHGEQTVLAKINLLSGLALIVVLVLSSLGVTAAVLARVVERRKEFALLQALGAKRRAVVLLLLYESVAIGGIASIVGYGLGTVLAMGTVERIFGVAVTPRLLAFVAGLAAALFVAAIAGFAGAQRTLRTLPAVVLKGE